MQKLLQDFSKALQESVESYFLGLIVTVPTEPGRLEIVDGQQRLATTAILLAAMREHLLRRDALIAEKITGLLSDIDTDARQRVPKLQLNTDDNEFFRSSILRLEEEAIQAPRFPSHKLLKNAKRIAAAHVKKIVSELREADHGDVLRDWMKFMVHRAKVILLTVPSKANAYKMFETLNDRGIQTSQSDLIKNHLFGEAQDRLADVQVKWSLMRGALETLGEREITLTFLRQAMTSLNGHVAADELFEAVEARVRGSRNAAVFLDTLESAANDYVAILSPNSEKWNTYPTSTRRSISAINLHGVKPMRPLTLSISRKFNRDEADSAFRALISWGTRLLITGQSRNRSVEIKLARAAKMVSDEEITTAQELASEVQRVVPNDVEFKEAFATASVSKASLARYCLRSLESVEKGEPEPWFIPNDDQEVINLEHVLPRKPKDNWPEFDADLVKAYCNKLGNQVLLQASSNTDLGNAPFSRKRSVYAASPYSLTSQVGSFVEWRPKDIVAQQKELADLAMQAWPLL